MSTLRRESKFPAISTPLIIYGNEHILYKAISNGFYVSYFVEIPDLSRLAADNKIVCTSPVTFLQHERRICNSAASTASNPPCYEPKTCRVL